MRFIIRDLAAADRQDWEILWAGYNAFYAAKVDPEVSDLTWTRLLDPAAPMFAFVAAAPDGALLGIVHCVLHPGTWAKTPLCYLEDLFTAPAARGQGVARALIEAVYARAGAEGWDRVYWLTDETNATARGLYDKVARRSGFIQYRWP